MKKLGLALGSGGSRGIAHIGFLKALDENNIKIDYISGCSFGAIVGACYCCGIKPDKMLKLAKSVKMSELIDVSIIPFAKGGLFISKKFKETIFNLIPESSYEKLKIPFSCVATDLDNGETIVLNDGDLKENVAASSSIPIFFRPIFVGGRHLIDGGVKCRVPIKQVRDMGADIVVAIDVLEEEKKQLEKYNTFNVTCRYISLMDDEISLFHKKKFKSDLYISPSLSGTSQYNLKDIDKIYKAGYEAGLNNIDKIKLLLKG